MRYPLLGGIALTLAAVSVVVVSGVFDLNLEPVALLGLAAGAVVALSHDHSAAGRLAAFGAGIGIALLGYLTRALVLPDSTSGGAVSVAIVMLLVTLLAATTGNRLPLWAALLGAGTFAGAYDRVYTAAPAELLSTGTETLTALLLAVAAGFLTGTIARPVTPAVPAATLPHTESVTVPTQSRTPRRADGGDEVELDDLLAS